MALNTDKLNPMNIFPLFKTSFFADSGLGITTIVFCFLTLLKNPNLKWTFIVASILTTITQGYFAFIQFYVYLEGYNNLSQTLTIIIWSLFNLFIVYFVNSAAKKAIADTNVTKQINELA